MRLLRIFLEILDMTEILINFEKKILYWNKIQSWKIILKRIKVINLILEKNIEKYINILMTLLNNFFI